MSRLQIFYVIIGLIIVNIVYFLINKCLDLFSIEYISYEMTSEVIELFTGIKLTRQNLFYIMDKYFNHYAYDCMKEIEDNTKS